MTDPQLARITILLKAARLEVVGLAPTDRALRLAIIADLDGYLVTLRGAVQEVLDRHGLTLADEEPIALALVARKAAA